MGEIDVLVADDCFTVSVRIDNEGRAAQVAGGPDSWEPAEPAEWSVVAVFVDYNGTPLDLGLSDVAHECLAAMWWDEINDAVTVWLDEHAAHVGAQ